MIGNLYVSTIVDINDEELWGDRYRCDPCTIIQIIRLVQFDYAMEKQRKPLHQTDSLLDPTK